MLSNAQIPEMETCDLAQAISFWTSYLDFTVEELLQFLDDNHIRLEELWIILKR